MKKPKEVFTGHILKVFLRGDEERRLMQLLPESMFQIGTVRGSRRSLPAKKAVDLCPRLEAPTLGCGLTAVYRLIRKPDVVVRLLKDCMLK